MSMLESRVTGHGSRITKMHFEKIQAKVQSRSQLAETVAHWRSMGERIVFTNGCFDLLHYGHLHYLAEARDLGHRLVIGVNADASVSRLKGPHRPIKDEQTRSLLLAAFECVDAVTIFEEETPLELIKTILPDVLVKGGDWKPEQIVGSDVVQANGGEVHSLPFVEGHSTTDLEAKILRSRESSKK